MATAPTAGYIYFVESESVGGDDWITDHAGDPDLLDLDLMTEGTEYCKLEMPRRWVKSFTTGIIITDSGGGFSYSLRNEAYAYKFLSEGIETSRTNGDVVEGFFTNVRHVAPAEASYKHYYLIVYFGTNDHVQFTDHNAARKSYCKGAVLGGSITWDDSNPKNVIVRLNFKSDWNALS